MLSILQLAASRAGTACRDEAARPKGPSRRPPRPTHLVLAVQHVLRLPALGLSHVLGQVPVWVGSMEESECKVRRQQASEAQGWAASLHAADS